VTWSRFRRRFLPSAVLALGTLIFACPASAQVGASCSTPLWSTLSTNGNNYYCYSGTFVYPAYQFGSANGASCSSTIAGEVQWTGSTLQFCDGSNWDSLGSVGGTAAAGSTTQLEYNNAGVLGGTAGLTWNSTNDALTLATIANPTASALTLTGGTAQTTNQPALNITQTWNNASGNFTGILENITNTTSIGTSKLIDLQVNGTSEFKVDEGGNVSIPTGAHFYTVAGSAGVYSSGAGSLYLGVNGGPALSIVNNAASQFLVSWSGNAVSLLNTAAATLHMGAADAAAPVAQTLGVQNVVGGTTNTAGANFTITGSQGTGTGAGGAILFQTAPAGLTGSTQNALATAMTIAGTGYVGIGTTSPIQALQIGSGNVLISSNQNYKIWNAASTQTAAEWGTSASDAAYLTAYLASLAIRTESANPIIFVANNSEAMRIISGGNVGIGTSSPGSMLQVNGNAAIGYPTNTGGPSNGLAVSGNVGIGTTAPLTSLHVGAGAIATIFDNGAGGSFTPGIVNSVPSGIAGVGASVNDGTHNSRATLFVNDTSGVWGLSNTYSSVSTPFVVSMGGAEKLRISTSGNVGTGPNAKLHVLNGTTTGLTANGSSSGILEASGVANYLQFLSPTATYEAIQFGNSSSNGDGAIYYTSANVSRGFDFWTAGTSRMVINSSGSVGIGTTSPGANLDVYSNSANPTVNIRNGSAVSYSMLNMYSQGGLIANLLAGSAGFYQSADTHFFRNAAQTTIYMQLASSGISLNENTSVTGTLTTTGNVGIGTTAPNANALLQLYSTTKGFLPPLLSTANETSMGTSLPTGLVVYNTDSGHNELENWNGTSWQAVGSTAAPAAGGSTTQLQYNNAGALGGTAGLTWDGTNDALTLATIANPASSALTITGGALTGTTSYPALNITQMWNNAGGNFTGILENVTNMTSVGTSRLIDLQVGGTTKFNVDESGNATAAGKVVAVGAGYNTLAFQISGTTSTGIYGSNAIMGFQTGTNVNLIINNGTNVDVPGATLGLSAGGVGISDTILSRQAAANLHLGAADAAAPVAQTLGAQNVVAGTTNTAGANFTITGSQGTGTGAGGSILFQTAPAGSTGTSQNALATAMTIAGSGYVGIGTTAPGSTLQVTIGTAATKGLIVQQAATQTADTQEWQNSSGAALMYIDSNATLQSNRSIGGGNRLDSTIINVSCGNSTGCIIGNANANIGIYGTISAAAAYTTGPFHYTTNGAGVLGASTAGPGVEGDATTGAGVYGHAHNGYGVYGYDDNVGIGGYFSSVSGYGLIVATGLAGIGTTSPTSLLNTVDTAAKVAAYTGVLHTVTNTSSTNSINKIGMDIESTGTWTGTSAVNTGLVVNATGGTTNYAATFSGGNVGIGTTSPSYNLVVGNNITGFSAPTAELIGNTSGDAAIYVGQGSSNVGALRWYYNSTPANAYLGLVTNAYNNPIRIDGSTVILNGLSSGNVGIGTTSPTSLLDSYDSAAKTAAYTGVLHDVFDTSSTASVNKVGMDIESTGTWNGTTAVNTGLVVNATGGTTNYAATFNGGNVGIGTTSPAGSLDVEGANGVILNAGNVAVGTTSIPTYGVYGTPNIFLSGELGIPNSTGSFMLYLKQNGAAQWVLGNSSVGTIFAFNTSNTVAVYEDFYINTFSHFSRIDGSLSIGTSATAPTSGLVVAGNVGIGTPSPQALLDMVQIGTTNPTGLRLQGDDVSTITLNVGVTSPAGPVLYTSKSRGSWASKTVVSSGDSLFSISPQGYDGSAAQGAGQINFQVDGPVSTGVVPGRIRFSTANSSGTTTEVMRITSGGSVGIGTVSPQATLDVNGYARLALQSSAPATCSGTNTGAIALNHLAQACACNGTSWIFADSVGAACSW
jgi:fibronectin-binding autotransporter adhesin